LSRFTPPGTTQTCPRVTFLSHKYDIIILFQRIISKKYEGKMNPDLFVMNYELELLIECKQTFGTSISKA
jgi:hypothetical protein